MPENHTIYQLKISLNDIKPPIWRRVLVEGNTLLGNLHLTIQLAMGWGNCHLYEFDIDKISYMPSMPVENPFMLEEEAEDVAKNTLEDAVSGRRIKFKYIYDMGDDWVHDIKVEKTLPHEEGAVYPRCVEGERACPPEDCGGIWGYSDILKIIADPKDESYEETLEWLGGKFNPEAFDLNAVNKELAKHFKKRTPKKKKVS